MAGILPSVTETQAFTALGTVIQSVVGCPVIRAQVNRTAMPVGDFIVMTQRSFTRLSTNVVKSTSTTKTMMQPVKWAIQIDCYGLLAADRATSISTILRDEYAAAQFTALGYDMQTLYADDAQQMPLISGEEQYIERWTFNAILQLNPVLTVAQQTANALTVGIINVDAIYPA